jgi:DnaJ-class molecular chaperone
MRDQAFRGFLALPETTAAEGWWAVLDVPSFASRDVITAAYRKLARRYHPDTPLGDRVQFERVERAYREALAALDQGMK